MRSKNVDVVQNQQKSKESKDKKSDQAAHINLKVKGQDGNEVFFRIKRSTQLKKLMNAYCDRQSVDLNSIAFLFDGRMSSKWRMKMKLMLCSTKPAEV
ncbi:hypothetical protein M5K25_015486 [Dendrobium thyrsiflorum]|uniref:Rad60/SUMO-like domain-containing protein n=1 Tax=Dendrobium thyrsiflorum TaxID=117978 RepID=A0ABD0UQQ8_DENTH